MCCTPIQFGNITNVKVMRDGDGDGKCQEENGKWVPCPPGVATGSKLRNGKPLGQTIANLTNTPAAPNPADDYIRNTPQPYFGAWLEARGTPYRELDNPQRRTLQATYMQLVTEERARRQQERRTNLQKTNPEILDENGNVKQEIIDNYLTEHRKKTADRAKQIEQQSQTQISQKSKQAAQRISMPQEPDEYELRQQYEYDNPRPERQDYDTTPDGLSEYRTALSDWEYDRDTYVYEEIDNASNPFRGMDDDIETAFNHTMIGKDGKTYESIITRTYWSNDDGLTIKGGIYDTETGKEIATYTRTLFAGNDPHTVYHDLLVFNEDHQGLGLASQFNAMNELIYQEIGINTITVTGASGQTMNGATHWPANGFTWDPETDSKTEFLNLIEQAINEQAIQNPIEAAILNELIETARKQTGYNSPLIAGDFIQWPEATQYFKNQNASFPYRRDI